MIKVCEHCSNVSIDALKKAVGESSIELGCLEKCAAYEKEAYGFVNGELIVESNSDVWIEKVSEINK